MAGFGRDDRLAFDRDISGCPYHFRLDILGDVVETRNDKDDEADDNFLRSGRLTKRSICEGLHEISAILDL